MTIRKLYDAKKLNAKRNGGAWFVPFADLYMEPGYNIRDGEINAEKVQAFADAYTAGEYVPAITVDVTEQGLRVNDGQHRYLGAKLAIENGLASVLLEVVDVTGIETGKKIARMVNANDGTPTSPIARANAYARMKEEGMTNDQIAKEVHRSPSDVANFLALAACPDDIKAMVSAGQMSYVMAIEMTKEHGDDAPAVAAEALEKAKAAGKEKVTKKFTAPAEPKEPKEPAEPAATAPKAPKAKPEALQPPFGKDQLTRLAELAVHVELVQGQEDESRWDDEQSLTLCCPAGIWKELAPLLNSYLGAK